MNISTRNGTKLKRTVIGEAKKQNRSDRGQKRGIGQNTRHSVIYPLNEWMNNRAAKRNSPLLALDLAFPCLMLQCIPDVRSTVMSNQNWPYKRLILLRMRIPYWQKLTLHPKRPYIHGLHKRDALQCRERLFRAMIDLACGMWTDDDVELWMAPFKITL